MIIKISMHLVKFLTRFNIFRTFDREKLIDNVIFLVFFLTSNVLFLFFAYIFGCIPEIIIILAVLNVLRLYTGGFHASSLDKCLCISVPYITLLAIIAKCMINYTGILGFISVIMGIYIIWKIPIMHIEDMKNKSKEWFMKRYIISFLFLYIVSCICINLNGLFFNIISTSISSGIIGVSMMMFDNKKKLSVVTKI